MQKKPRTVTLPAVRCNATQLKRWKKCADKEQRTLSAWIRLVLERVSKVSA